MKVGAVIFFEFGAFILFGEAINERREEAVKFGEWFLNDIGYQNVP